MAELFFKSNGEINVTERINYIENQVYAELKKYGFRKHGRTLHRFVSEDISQVVNFQCGQAYRDETHLMWVNLGIRIPECFERSFEPAPLKKYYDEARCTIRSRLGEISPGHLYKVTTYDLRRDIEKQAKQITKEILEEVMPVFEVLSSREMILQHRRDYPHFDVWNKHLILLEEAMIYGHCGDMQKAREAFDTYYQSVEKEFRLTGKAASKGHLEYLDKLAEKLGLR